jgi:ribose-phosphate pyrophosphokinase
MSPIIIAFPKMEKLGREIANHIHADFHLLDLHRFPDGENLITLPEAVAGRDVIFLATLLDPNRLALPLRFGAATARELGARRVGLIAPYLAYMRQDRRFAPGQAITAHLFAAFLDECFDWLITVDPHLHRIATLDQLFTIPVRRVVTAPLIAKWIATEVPDAILLGPDSESQQWVADVARAAGRPYEVLRKVRTGDRNVDVSLPVTAPLMDGTPVVLDDIASSGRTMVRAIERLRMQGTTPPVCIVIHAVFADNAYKEILMAGAARVVSTDTIVHPSNSIGIAPLLADFAVQFSVGIDPPVAGRPIL